MSSILARVARVGCVSMVASALLLAPSLAHADDECPLGSVLRTENAQTWCEPTVCDVDSQCPTGSLCRPVPLCVEVGVLEPGAAPAAAAAKDDAGPKLMVRQRCGADKSCPQRTTCSEKSRCITRAQAERAGLLTAGAASGAASTGTTGTSSAGEPAKKSCGCRAAGSRGGERDATALVLLGMIAIVARRRTSAAGTIRH
jgi:MYXO-CTERM domain-containing protein